MPAMPPHGAAATSVREDRTRAPAPAEHYATSPRSSSSQCLQKASPGPVHKHKPLAILSLPPQLNPKTWSRASRAMALAGLLVVIVLALTLGIVLPLTLRPRQAAAPAKPVLKPNDLQPIAGGNTTLRVMALGASITYGFLSSDGNGYRNDLLTLLHRSGNKHVTFVGSRNNGTMRLNAVEGWPGYRIDQVLHKAQTAVPHYLPNVVLLNAGTNDCLQGFDLGPATVDPETAGPTESIGSRMRATVDAVLAWSPRATVVLSTLLHNLNATIQARVDDANDQFRDVAANLSAAGVKVVLADMSPAVGGPNSSTMADYTHPNDVGYALMANRWYLALVEASKKGFIVSPE